MSKSIFDYVNEVGNLPPTETSESLREKYRQDFRFRDTQFLVSLR